jgi:hypothetical protein
LTSVKIRLLDFKLAGACNLGWSQPSDGEFSRASFDDVCMVTNQDLTPEKEVSFPLKRYFNVFVHLSSVYLFVTLELRLTELAESSFDPGQCTGAGIRP